MEDGSLRSVAGKAGHVAGCEGFAGESMYVPGSCWFYGHVLKVFTTGKLDLSHTKLLWGRIIWASPSIRNSISILYIN